MSVDANTVVLFLIALANAFTAYMVQRTHKVAVQTQEYSLQTEKNTNSMKDALVAATDKASFAAGKDEARGEGERKAAALAEGRLAAELQPETHQES